MTSLERCDRDAGAPRSLLSVMALLERGRVRAEESRPTLPAAPGAPKYPDFVFPAAPARLAPARARVRHQVAWQWLQAGDLRAAERNFGAALKEAPAFYPSEAGLGYVALAKTTTSRRRSHFERALAANPAYAPALAGRGEALLKLGEREQALRSFEAAIAADPQLSALRSRIDVLRFRGLQNDVDAARKAAEAGQLAEAHALYRADDRGLARQPLPLSRAGRRRTAGRQPGGRPRARAEGGGAQPVRVRATS